MTDSVNSTSDERSKRRQYDIMSRTTKKIAEAGEYVNCLSRIQAQFGAKESLQIPEHVMRIFQKSVEAFVLAGSLAASVIDLSRYNSVPDGKWYLVKLNKNKIKLYVLPCPSMEQIMDPTHSDIWMFAPDGTRYAEVWLPTDPTTKRPIVSIQHLTTCPTYAQRRDVVSDEDSSGIEDTDKKHALTGVYLATLSNIKPYLRNPMFSLIGPFENIDVAHGYRLHMRSQGRWSTLLLDLDTTYLELTTAITVQNNSDAPFTYVNE